MHLEGDKLPLDEPLMLATSTQAKEEPFIKLDPLTNIQVYAYGVGHFLNDIVAGLITNYCLYYLIHKEPIDVDPEKAASFVGLVFLVGQLADGLMTPLVGLLSDKFDTRFGKRMPWYYVGVILVSLPMIYMFQPCMLCKLAGEGPTISFINYAFFIVLLNLGWAMCQVSHMSLVPSLSFSRTRRDMLNNLRGTFTFVANLAVLVIAGILFAVLNNEKLKYEVLCQASIVLGLLSSLFFVYHIRERPLTRACEKLARQYKSYYAKLSTMSLPSKLSLEANDSVGAIKEEQDTNQIMVVINDGNKVEPNDSKDEQNDHGAPKSGESTDNSFENENEQNNLRQDNGSLVLEIQEEKKFYWYHWLKSVQFWVYGGVYMSARIYCNVPITLLLFYLSYSLKFSGNQEGDKTPFAFALIPMVIFISSSLIATQLSRLYKMIGRKGVFTIAAFASLLVGAGLLFLPSDLRSVIYVAAFVLGLVQCAVLNSAIAYISEVVGTKEKNGAFVYGVYSFFEKVANGILLWIILKYKDTNSFGSDTYMRLCISIVPCAAVMFGWVCLLFGKATDYKTKGIENPDAIIDVSLNSTKL